MSVEPRTKPRIAGDESGAALVVALLILLALTVLGAALVSSVQIEDKITGYQRRDAQALTIAEAGMQEAIIRLRTGEVPDNLNKYMVTLIYEAPAGSIPVSGADTTSLPTLQTAGSYLGYSSDRKGYIKNSTSVMRVMSVKYRTQITSSPPDTQIVRYDDTATPKLNTATGTPVFQITAVGTKGNTTRGVTADVTRDKFNLMTRGAVAAQVAIQFKGNIKICGHDHLYATPAWTEPPDCNVGQYEWWTLSDHSTCMPGGWSESEITQQGSPTVIGEPAGESEYQVGFYTGPWDALGLPQTDFWPWIGNPITSEPNPANGIFYLDNNTVKQDQSGNFTYNGGSGEGLLYVDGDMNINGNFTYKGMIYVEGDLRLNGNAWILGGIMVKGKATVKIANGSAVVLYSSDAIQQAISKFGGDMRMLSWREF